jgi:hypothetical protein
VVAVACVAAAPNAAEAASPPARYADCKGKRWSCCVPEVEPCTRPGAARALLLSLGVLAGGGAAGLLFLLGDRLTNGEPATLLVGTGALAGAGAIVGAVAGRLGADRRGHSDRIRPATIGLEHAFGRAPRTDERNPGTMQLRIAPTLRFANGGGRVRLLANFGGWPLAAKVVDPRPQFDEPIAGQDGTAPIALEQRRMVGGVGLDFAVWLPYPLLRRSAHLGPAELRWRPEVQFARERFEPTDEQFRIVERTMLLPLTIGMRWHISPRQRFTFYVGPRFDLVAWSDPGSKELHRGKPQIGPLYGEAWYDIDVPFTLRARRDGRMRRVDVNGMLTIGYVHSRWDGRGFNFGPVIGFLGPVKVAWGTRVRPRGSKTALQGGVGATIGNGVTLTLDVGVILPEVYGRKKP